MMLDIVLLESSNICTFHNSCLDHQVPTIPLLQITHVFEDLSLLPKRLTATRAAKQPGETWGPDKTHGLRAAIPIW